MERQYCASSFVIDFETAEILLMYNKKLKKWLQPGAHNWLETPIEACVREVKEETGIDIKILDHIFLRMNMNLLQQKGILTMLEI